MVHAVFYGGGGMSYDPEGRFGPVNRISKREERKILGISARQQKRRRMKYLREGKTDVRFSCSSSECVVVKV
jgi:hypothetical protein